MKLIQTAMAGTLESSDAQVVIEPWENDMELEVTSSVMNQYGRRIRQVVLETLERLGVEKVKVTVNDQGALDCTLKARVEAAVYRSLGKTEGIPWGGEVR